LKKLNIPVFFADELPPLEELRALARSKAGPAILDKKYLEDHTAVQRSVEYQFKNLKATLDFAEDPANSTTPLYKVLIQRLNRGLWINMRENSFETRLRALRVLLKANHCAPLWLNKLLTD